MFSGTSVNLTWKKEDRHAATQKAPSSEEEKAEAAAAAAADEEENDNVRATHQPGAALKSRILRAGRLLKSK